MARIQAFYELAFGTPIAYLFLLFIWKRLFKASHAGWKYALITLVGVQYLGAHRVVPVELRPVPGLNPAPVTEK
jgi:hypothetical protein